jgi:hypothetical protein
LCVQQFLSEQLTEGYWAEIKDDMYDDYSHWDTVKKHYLCKRDCLTGAVFLERALLKEYGRLELLTGP